jgi:monoamine oxidase
VTTTEPGVHTVVIGAGAAGLAAAATLARAGACALVLEARERIGGRIWSHHEPGLPVPIELGAELIHGRARATFALLERAGAAAVDTGGQRWTLRNGRLERSAELFAEVRRALQESRALDERDLAFGTYLERHLARRLSPEARAFARMLAEGFDAADTKRASARALVREWTGGSSVDAPQFRPLGGYSALLARLEAELRGTRVRLQLGTVVERVCWKRGEVTVHARFLGRSFRVQASRALVTLPLGVLQESRGEGSVRFEPALARKRKALGQLAPGPVLKVLLRFRHAFWEKLDHGRYARAAFFHVPGAAFPTFWTALPVRVPLLVAWAAGPNAARLQEAPKSRIVAAALASLSSMFDGGELAAGLESAWVHDWQSDPFARGAYSYERVGGERARVALAEPLLDTLYFAGEATDVEGEAGTVAGALQSGERAAREALAPLRGAERSA